MGLWPNADEPWQAAIERARLVTSDQIAGDHGCYSQIEVKSGAGYAILRGLARGLPHTKVLYRL